VFFALFWMPFYKSLHIKKWGKFAVLVLVAVAVVVFLLLFV